MTEWDWNRQMNPEWFDQQGRFVPEGQSEQPMQATPYRGRNRLKQMFADGGRVEPKVGSRSPVRTGGGGALTPNALLALVQAQQTQPEPGGQSHVRIAEVRHFILPANPLTQPEAILGARMRAAGAYMQGGEVNGPGGPKDDLIPAWLSNEEHVIDAAAVKGIGEGFYATSHRRLNKLREAARCGKAS